MVLDNHSAHIEKKSVELLQEHFNVCFLVPHSPAFNSIENLWLKVKELLATKLLFLPERLKTQDEVELLVLKTAEEYCTNETALNGIIRSNRSTMLRWVGEGNGDD